VGLKYATFDSSKQRWKGGIAASDNTSKTIEIAHRIAAIPKKRYFLRKKPRRVLGYEPQHRWRHESNK
jgi:hypothetical protein